MRGDGAEMGGDDPNEVQRAPPPEPGDAQSCQGLHELQYVPDLEYLQHVADEQFVCAED